MKKKLTNQLKKGILTLCLSAALPGTALSAELIYSLAAGQGEALRAENTEVAVQLALASPEQISPQDKVFFPLPNGQLVTGTVFKTLEGNGPTELEQQATSITVISLDNNGGGLRIIEQDGTVTGMILVDNNEKKIYQAALDSDGFGILQEEDRNKHLCVDFPGQNGPRLAQIPLIAELTPDLTTLQNLESRPGASKTLYINYWGGTLSGTDWNTAYNSGNDIIYTPYSSDADTNSFSTGDRYNMWLAWEEAAEDFAPFDINVTTKESVYLATPVANRVQMIATTTNYFYTGAGGVAYVGIFGTTNDTYRTGFVWNSGAGSLGITISHEAGHQIGLSHDGNLFSGYDDGHGTWGPIMGSPFNKAYVQWSKGEYDDANNQEDDLNIITGVLGALADDAGNTNAAATSLILPVTNQEGQITADGVFSDVDVYSFAASGSTQIEVIPLLGDEGENRAANLAMNVTLKNAAGSIIASISSSDNSPLAPNTNTFVYDGSLTSGTYYLAIDGISPDTNWSTGFGEYGNGGMYRMSVSTSVSSDPDLIVVSPSVNDNTLTPSQSFTLYATVENQGTGTANSTTLLYYRSADATITSADMQIGIDAVSSLAAGATSPQNTLVAAPATEGTYWVGACVSAVSGESDITNQCSTGVQITVAAETYPDLTVIAPAVSDNTLTPGQSFTINATAKNQGTATANSSTLRYYRSTNATITTSDTQLTTDSIGSLAAGATSPQNASVTAPTSEGTYWVGACIDTVTNESSTSNQCSTGVQITVAAKIPDLTVISPAVSDNTLTPGQSFTINATAKNQGTATANSSTLRYYRSTDATITTSDTQLTTDSIGSLAAGATSPQNASVSAPTSEGTYWVGACIDTVTNESSPSNQCSTGVQITVGQGQSFSWLLFYPAIFASHQNIANPGDSCGTGMILDCVLNCVNEATANNWIGDNSCDDGTWEIDLRCEVFNWDNGDCN
ncbi:MAG: CARDB domain-containing protein [Candidatus Electrothrix communis]|nr:MAG: CARDB domain-containing protein [Candidatus Electrothrix communis]